MRSITTGLAGSRVVESRSVTAVWSELEALHTLASSLVARWDELDEAGRLAQVKEILRATSGRAIPREEGAALDRTARIAGLALLTRSELEVLHAIADGETTAAMADRSPSRRSPSGVT